MIQWLKNLFECKTENEHYASTKRRYPTSRKRRKRLTKEEVLHISKDIVLGKKRQLIMQTYNISGYTYHHILRGTHRHQRG